MCPLMNKHKEEEGGQEKGREGALEGVKMNRGQPEQRQDMGFAVPTRSMDSLPLTQAQAWH